MTPRRRYGVACALWGAVTLAGVLKQIFWPDEWTFAAIPLLGVCLTAFLWCAAARLWLCRDARWLDRSFARPVRLALSVPVWLGATCLLYLLPGTAQTADETLRESIVLLTLAAGTFLVPVAALGFGGAALWTAVRHLRRTPDTETRAYREGPFALALLLFMGTCALLGCFAIYLL